MKAANLEVMLDVRMAHAIGLVLSGLIRDRTDFGVWFDHGNEATILAYNGETPIREWKIHVDDDLFVHVLNQVPDGKLENEIPTSKPEPEPPTTGSPQP